MLSKEFVEETSRLIAQFQKRKIQVQNGNILIAKIKAEEKTAGGIFLVDDTKDVKNYHRSIGRILANAENNDQEKYKPGSYVVFGHEARYKPDEDGLRAALDYLVQKEFIFAVQDNEVLFVIPEEVMHGNETV